MDSGPDPVPEAEAAREPVNRLEAEEDRPTRRRKPGRSRRSKAKALEAPKEPTNPRWREDLREALETFFGEFRWDWTPPSILALREYVDLAGVVEAGIERVWPHAIRYFWEWVERRPEVQAKLEGVSGDKVFREGRDLLIPMWIEALDRVRGPLNDLVAGVVPIFEKAARDHLTQATHLYSEPDVDVLPSGFVGRTGSGIEYRAKDALVRAILEELVPPLANADPQVSALLNRIKGHSQLDWGSLSEDSRFDAILRGLWQEAYPDGRKRWVAEEERKRLRAQQNKARAFENRAFDLGISPITADDMEETPDWLVEDVLVRGQPAIVGGPAKTLKTSLMLDLVVSLTAGLPFLGKFPVPEKRRVVMFSGESGKKAVLGTLRRVAVSRGLGAEAVTKSIKEGNLIVYDGLPKLAGEEGLDFLARLHQIHHPDVVIIDPIYLCLTMGREGIQTSNLFEVGPLLSRLTAVFQDWGSTPILVHHSTKHLPLAQVMRPDDLAFAGLAEFARQWILLNRRKTVKWDGRHELVASIGGSAGHSSVWNVTVDEGQMDSDFGGRKWDVTVEKPPQKVPNQTKTAGEARDESDPFLATLQKLIPTSRDGWVGLKELKAALPRGGSTWKKVVESWERAGLVEVKTVGLSKYLKLVPGT